MALGVPEGMVTNSLLRGPATVGGLLLACATKVVGAVRQDPRPLHPRGEWWAATLQRVGSPTSTGAAWLDEVGVDDVLVRFSTAVGLPGRWPEIPGVALRAPIMAREGAGFTDVLWASTGTGDISRYVLRPARAAHGSPYTTLLPYLGPRGPVLLALRKVVDRRYELAHSGATGTWWVFATLTLRQEVPAPGGGEAVRFDPVLSPPPGLRNFEWAVRLREPSYRVARG